MAQISIPNETTWSGAATALNSNFDEIYSRTGWASYTDTLYTPGSPLVVTVGTTVGMPNNAATTILTQLPDDVPLGMYDGSRLISPDDGSFYTLRVSLTMQSSVNEGAFAVSVDISAAGDGSITIAGLAVRCVRGAGSPQVYTLALPYFTGATFVANGGKIRFESISGNSTVHSISYLIERTHRAR